MVAGGAGRVVGTGGRGEEQRGQGGRQQVGAEHVGGERALHPVGGGLVGAGERPGVVHQGVEARRTASESPPECGHGRGIREVDQVEVGPARAGRLDHAEGGGTSGRVAAHQVNIGTEAGQCGGDGQADARGGSGDEGHAAFHRGRVDPLLQPTAEPDADAAEARGHRDFGHGVGSPGQGVPGGVRVHGHVASAARRPTMARSPMRRNERPSRGVKQDGRHP